jgi:DNA-binding CsgD family transcriptional regulator
MAQRRAVTETSAICPCELQSNCQTGTAGLDPAALGPEKITRSADPGQSSVGRGLVPSPRVSGPAPRLTPPPHPRSTRDRHPSLHHRRPAVGLVAPMRRKQSRQREVHREPQAGDGGHREGQPPTPRQLEIFRTVARSRSRADAADALGITEQSIKNQFSHLFRRLGVGGELQAAWVLWGRRRKAKR